MPTRNPTERGFQATVIALAKLYKWLVYHTHDSRRSQAGFPDLVLVKSPRIIYAELKTSRGKVRPEQVAWLEALRACGCDARLWRPEDWPEIERTLKGEDVA